MLPRQHLFPKGKSRSFPGICKTLLELIGGCCLGHNPACAKQFEMIMRCVELQVAAIICSAMERLTFVFQACSVLRSSLRINTSW